MVQHWLCTNTTSASLRRKDAKEIYKQKQEIQTEILHKNELSIMREN